MRCLHCHYPDGAHYPYCRTQLSGEDLTTYLEGEKDALKGSPPLQQSPAYSFGYIGGKHLREQKRWESILDKRIQDVRKKVFHERLDESRSPGTLIHRDPLIHHTDMAKRIVQDGGVLGDWMIRATFFEGRWVTVPYNEKGIFCVSRTDPYFDWEVLIVIATNPKKSVLFVEPTYYEKVPHWEI